MYFSILKPLSHRPLKKILQLHVPLLHKDWLIVGCLSSDGNHSRWEEVQQ